MRTLRKGECLCDLEWVVSEQKLDELAAALGTSTAHESATLVPFVGLTILGDQHIAEFLELDSNRAAMGKITYHWNRPFRAGETVHLRVAVEDTFEKKHMRFVTMQAEARDSVGDVIHRQEFTIIERGVPAS